MINVISNTIAVVVRLRPTLILFVHGPCGSSLLRSNLKYFFVDCLIFRHCLAFVYPDFSVQIPCYSVLHSTVFTTIWFMVRARLLVYGVLWWSAVFLAVLGWSAVFCGFQAYR